jgi:hypothetical protein
MGVVTAMAFGPVPARAADDAWSDDARWISVRAGSAGSGARLAPGGGYGYGFGYTWFLAKEVAWSANVQHDLLGRYAGAAEIEVPITVEFTKHFRFSATARPYLGAGWGAIYHKTYRTYRTDGTRADELGLRQGLYLATGGNAVLNAGSLIGVDIRLMREQDTRSINPTFPNAEASSTNWSIKLSYSRVL